MKFNLKNSGSGISRYIEVQEEDGSRGKLIASFQIGGDEVFVADDATPEEVVAAILAVACHVGDLLVLRRDNGGSTSEACPVCGSDNPAEIGPCFNGCRDPFHHTPRRSEKA